MEIMTAGRRAGKTTKLIEKLKANHGAILVVSTIGQAQEIKRHCPDIANRIYAANSAERLRGVNPSEVYVDDLDNVVHTLLGRPVKFATMTKDNENENTWWEEAAEITSSVYNSVYESTKNHSLAEQVSRDASNQFMLRAVDW